MLDAVHEKAQDVSDTLDIALTASGCDQARIIHKPRLLPLASAESRPQKSVADRHEASVHDVRLAVTSLKPAWSRPIGERGEHRL